VLEPEYNIGKFWQEVSSRRKYINADKSICNVGNLDLGSKRLERPTKLRRPHQPMDYLTPAVVYYNHVKQITRAASVSPIEGKDGISI
jgi:hypothetical protein